MKCPAKGPKALDDKLPEIANCTATDKTKCNGWKFVGSLQGDKQIGAPPNGANDKAILFTWRGKDEDGLAVQCLYLARRKGMGAPAALKDAEGVLCFNEATCEACAYNLFAIAPSPPKFSGLDQPANGSFAGDEGKTGGAACPKCHVSGVIAPTRSLHDILDDDAWALNKLCSSKGGPTWRDAFANAPAPAGTWKGPFPGGSNCLTCHKEGFAKAADATQKDGPDGSWCNAIIPYALTLDNGSMKNGKKGSVFKTAGDCVTFVKGVACDGVCDLICPESDKGAACTAATDCCSNKCTANKCE